MKLQSLHIALILSSLTLSLSAKAIDQVTLKNGEVVEGKVLSDVPNRHVDIQLVNGNKKRYQQSEVASVERDVPSNVDRKMSGSDSEFYFAPQLGANFSLESGGGTSFVWGGKAGVNVTQLGDFAKLAFGLTYFREQSSGTIAGIAYTSSVNLILVQALFRKVANSGFYFGPEFGLGFQTMDATIPVYNIPVTLSGNAFTFGLDVGYDYYVSSGFSFGPDVHYHYIGKADAKSSSPLIPTTQTDSTSSLSVLLNATFHF